MVSLDELRKESDLKKLKKYGKDILSDNEYNETKKEASELEGEAVILFWRKKIRHVLKANIDKEEAEEKAKILAKEKALKAKKTKEAGKEPPPELSKKDKARYIELWNKHQLRSKSGELDLRDMATKLGVNRRTVMTKGPLILAIIEKEKILGTSKTKSKKASKDSEEEEEDEPESEAEEEESEAEESEEDSLPIPPPRRRRAVKASPVIATESEEEEESLPLPPPRRRRAVKVSPVIIDDNDDDGGDEIMLKPLLRTQTPKPLPPPVSEPEDAEEPENDAYYYGIFLKKATKDTAIKQLAQGLKKFKEEFNPKLTRKSALEVLGSWFNNDLALTKPTFTHLFPENFNPKEIIDASGLFKPEASCSEKDDYKCPDDLACNLSTKFCEEPSSKPSKNIGTMEYKGHKIIGTEKDIKELKKKLEKETKVAKDCGEYTYNELLDKKLSELQKILKNKGHDASGIDNKEKASNLICQLEKNKKSCPDYKCPDGLACDISANPGICVDPNKAKGAGDIEWLEYEGKQIVGSKEAINSLKKKLGLDKDFLTGDKKTILLKKLKLLGKTDKQLEKLKEFSIAKLEILVEAEEIDEVPGPGDAKELSMEELNSRATLIKNQPSNSKKELVDELASLLQKNPSEFKDWTLTNLKIRLDSVRNSKPAEDEEVEEASSDEIPLPPRKRTSKRSVKPVPTESEEEQVALPYPKSSKKPETKPKPKPKSESEEEQDTKSEAEVVHTQDEDEIALRRHQENVDLPDVEKVLSDVMSGKKTGQLEQFSQVQNTVLKCLGLISG